MADTTRDNTWGELGAGLDPAAGWDAHAAESAGDAVVRCGKPALPFLKARRKERGVAGLIRLIEEGAKGGF